MFNFLITIIKTNKKGYFIIFFTILIVFLRIRDININEYEKHDIYNNSFKLFVNKKTTSRKFLNSSKDYWEKRYQKGGNSGAGSFNNLAHFKAEILNDFIKSYNIDTIIEWGSGDCNQLSLANYKNYIGFDVSKTAINICKNKFHNDSTKTFIYIYDKFKNNKKADLSISLDVIYHLLEDKVYNNYMYNLFESSKKYICIYSSNIDVGWASHVRHRKFTDWIDTYASDDWKLIKYIKNKYPFKPKNMSTSFADFYFYEKIKCKFKVFGVCVIH